MPEDAYDHEMENIGTTFDEEHTMEPEVDEFLSYLLSHFII